MAGPFRETGEAFIERRARLKLDRLEAAATIQDFAALPGDRFEALAADRRAKYNILINDGEARRARSNVKVPVRC